MKRTSITLGCVASLFAIALYFASCKKENITTVKEGPQGDPVLPDTPYDYASKHGVDNNYATLGRVLFYDKNLSVNNTTACGSCHKQQFAFANDKQFDVGFNGLPLKRNSPSIQGFRGFKSKDMKPSSANQKDVLMFWDGRQRSLPDMVLNPVMNHNEMSMPGFEELISKLNSIAYYPPLFQKAFGTPEITKERISFALQSFLACLNTHKSGGGITIDPAISDGTKPPTNQVEMGQFLFHSKYNCAECHDQNAKSGIFIPANDEDSVVTAPPAPYGGASSPGPDPNNPNSKGAMFNIGLDVVYSDKGLGALTGKAADQGLFKVPTLQNISVTAPYMHDGRFKTLDQVLDHYSHNIQPNNNLSPLFKNFDGTPKKLNILPAEKAAIIAFLNTLKDEDFLTNPMYSNPFNSK